MPALEPYGGRGQGISLVPQLNRRHSGCIDRDISNETSAMQTNQTNESSPELTRLQEDREGRAAWKKWGPYLSERQWGDRARRLQLQRRRLELLHP